MVQEGLLLIVVLAKHNARVRQTVPGYQSGLLIGRDEKKDLYVSRRLRKLYN